VGGRAIRVKFDEATICLGIKEAVPDIQGHLLINAFGMDDSNVTAAFYK
jgi:hypothetical protein